MKGLQRAALVTVLLISIIQAETSIKKSITRHKIPQANGPYSIQVTISNETSVLFFAIDTDTYVASNGTCYLNSHAHFKFSCPVECLAEECLLTINLPEVSFIGILAIKINETDYYVYYHQRQETGSHRPVFTQQSGPFIFETYLPRAPVMVLLNEKSFVVEAEKGICEVQNTTEGFRCKVEKLAEFSRITIFLPEIKNINVIMLGAQGPDESTAIYWISVEHISYALSDSRVFVFENESSSSINATESDIELTWRLRDSPARINASYIACYSNEKDICGFSAPCVLEEDGDHSVLKYRTVQGRENIVFFTCQYEDKEKFDFVTYRHLWPGLEAFEGGDRSVHSDLANVELAWVVKSWGPRAYRTLQCKFGDIEICSGLTTTFEEGKCHIKEMGDTFTFSPIFERIENMNESTFICMAGGDIQKQTIYWYDNLTALLSENTPEFVIPFNGSALADALRNYLKNARIHVVAQNGFFRMHPNANIEVTCVIDNRSMSWLCEVHFKDAIMQLLLHHNSGTNVDEGILNGTIYELFGNFEICESNAGTMGKLETKHAKLITSAKNNDQTDDTERSHALTDGLAQMLSKGLRSVCHLPS